MLKACYDDQHRPYDTGSHSLRPSRSGVFNEKKRTYSDAEAELQAVFEQVSVTMMSHVIIRRGPYSETRLGCSKGSNIGWGRDVENLARGTEERGCPGDEEAGQATWVGRDHRRRSARQQPIRAAEAGSRCEGTTICFFFWANSRGGKFSLHVPREFASNSHTNLNQGNTSSVQPVLGSLHCILR
jgi:hypothetical protein